MKPESEKGPSIDVVCDNLSEGRIQTTLTEI